MMLSRRVLAEGPAAGAGAICRTRDGPTRARLMTAGTQVAFATPVLRRLSIFVAEDEAYLREWLVLLLRSLGARVRVARDGWELLLLICRGIASGGTPDLVVSDIHMPRASGLEVLDAVRAFGIQTPFLLITDAGSPEIKALAAALDATVLDKPFSARVFRARVGELCRLDLGGDQGPALA